MLEESQERVQFDLPARLIYLPLLGDCIAKMLHSLDGLIDPETTLYNIQLATHELCTNIIQHAYQASTGSERIEIQFCLDRKARRFRVNLRDRGRQFDITEVAEPDLEQAQVHGYGLFLVRSLMDQVEYTHKGGYNEWQIVKFL
jgi:Anti-sigma regulatory factor (Ser/Thr protein kinase)